MMLVDTNVVSEVFRPQADPAVMAWLAAQDTPDLHISAVSVAELLVGMALLPAGPRRDDLQRRADDALARIFGPRILAFDTASARRYAELVPQARRGGRAVSIPDAQIGAIASVRGLTVATRDTAPFTAMNVPVLNPWRFDA